MGEENICCCPARTCTVGIGWFQVVRGALILCGIFFMIWTRPLGTSTYSQILTTAVAILIVIEVLNFIMGVVLLRGLYNRNISQIPDWMTSVVFSTALIGISAVALCFLSPDWVTITLSIIVFTLVLIFNGFALWVVGSFKKELLEGSHGSVDPLVDHV